MLIARSATRYSLFFRPHPEVFLLATRSPLLTARRFIFRP